MARREAERSETNAAARDALVAAAVEASAEWGCPAAGHTPPAQLPRHLAVLSKHAATVVGLDETPRTCPFACLQRCDPWVAELSDAAAIAETYSTPIPDVLGRPLTRADVDALGEILRARAESWESDQKIAEKERAKDHPP